MARPTKQGLDYFPLDVNFIQDIRMRKLVKYQGGRAVTVYALLLCIIYKDGYYIRRDKELPFIISEQSGFDEAYIGEVINCCLNIGLLSKEMYEKHGVLTSRGIQTRYQQICGLSRRKCVIEEFSLVVSSEETVVSSEETPISSEETGVNSEETGVNSAKTPQRKKKKSKENISPHNPPLGEKRAVARCGMDFLKDLLSSITPEAFERQLKAMDLSRDRFEEVALMVLRDWEDFNEPQRNARHLFNHVRRKIAADPSLKSLPKRQAKAQYWAERAQERRQRDAEAEEIRSSGKTSWQLYCERNGLDPDKTSAADLAAAKSNESKSTE